jgi:plastocyanin
MMAFMDHGLPARVAGGTLSEAHVTWTFAPDVGDEIEFVWDIGHTVTATGSDDRLLDEWIVGDPEKATTSRRTVENSIREYLNTRLRDAREART